MSTNRSTSNEIRTTLYVKGMHCAACEIIIKKTLEEVDGVTSVQASTSNSQVTITHEKTLKPDLKVLNAALSDHGYTLSYKDQSKSEKPLLYKENGALLYNPDKLQQYSVNVALVIIVVAVFFWITESGVAASVMVSTGASPIAYLLFGLVAGASTCAALVGGLILSLSKRWNEQYSHVGHKLGNLVPHGVFYIGRLVSFTIAGGVLALLGASITSTVTVLAPFVTMAVAGVMLILGLQMLNVSWANKIKLALPGGLGAKVAESSGSSSSKLTPFYMGAASLLLPCGMTLTAFITSIASESFMQGAVNMFMFALGSMLSLSFISFASVGFGTHKSWSGRFNTVAGMMVLFFALFTFNSQLNALGLPSANDMTLLFRSSDNTAQTVLGDQNVQIMSMEASAYGYSPTSFTVKAGIPVRWEINNTGASGCTNAIIARDFFSGQFPLNPGMNVIEFTPTTLGTYKFSCWMGMVSGVIKVM